MHVCMYINKYIYIYIYIYIYRPVVAPSGRDESATDTTSYSVFFEPRQ